MDDLISRQAAIDTAIGWLKDRLTDRKNGESLADRLKHLPSVQQWTPCSEQLPEEKDAGILKKLGTEKRSEYVLATVEVNGERMTVTACTYDGKWDWNMKYAFPDFKIVAWRELPEPYKGEQE